MKTICSFRSPFTAHDSDFNDFTILCRDNNGFRLLSKESILICRDSSVLNKNTGSLSLLLFDSAALFIDNGIYLIFQVTYFGIITS